MLKLNETEKAIFSGVLEHAAEKLGNQRCCDWPVECTVENRDALVKIIDEYAYNDPDWHSYLMSQAMPGKIVCFADWMILRLLMRKLDLAA
jgi:hypothetical protein